MSVLEEVIAGINDYIGLILVSTGVASSWFVMRAGQKANTTSLEANTGDLRELKRSQVVSSEVEASIKDRLGNIETDINWLKKEFGEVKKLMFDHVLRSKK